MNEWPPAGLPVFYHDEFSCVINDDCRKHIDKIPQFDIVMADPPFGMNFKSGFRSGKWDEIQGDE